MSDYRIVKGEEAKRIIDRLTEMATSYDWEWLVDPKTGMRLWVYKGKRHA